MINRTMVRTKVMQCLFAYYQDGDKTVHQSRKDLLKSFSDTYNLYGMLLSLMDELSTYAGEQISEAENRAKATHRVYTANRHFAESRLSKQVFSNHALRHLIDNSHLSWDAGMSVMSTLMKQLQEKDYYRSFMQLSAPTYEDEKGLWKKIYSDLLPDNEALVEALEEMEISLDQANWSTDLNVVLSYVVKTIKRFSEESGAEQELLQMFDSEDELHFGEKLLEEAINRKQDLMDKVNAHLKNWDMERIAYMDQIILQVALTEIYVFPEIAAEVSMNEYIELTKEYSGDKSYLFVNGILEEILRSEKCYKLTK
ncbi:MAG: transcription antitermination protein NusB [Paludibacteraceae bacterium]|nr:transcription antitermination protein NusB [Paludibacteraceae bacterium]